MRKYILRAIHEGKILPVSLLLIDKIEFVEIECEIDSYKVNVEDKYPFFALIKLREELEKKDIRLLCNGARRDVYPSGASIIGVMAYELKMGQQATKLVDIFEPYDDILMISNTLEQKEYRSKWINSLG